MVPPLESWGDGGGERKGPGVFQPVPSPWSTWTPLTRLASSWTLDSPPHSSSAHPSLGGLDLVPGPLCPHNLHLSVLSIVSLLLVGPCLQMVPVTCQGSSRIEGSHQQGQASSDVSKTLHLPAGVNSPHEHQGLSVEAALKTRKPY